jgi:hypothetical protein
MAWLAGCVLVIAIGLPALFWITNKIEELNSSDSDWYAHFDDPDSED